MSREQKTVKSAPNIGEKQECRACLCKLGSQDVSYQIFDTWTPPMQGTKVTIAEDLAETANIQLSPKDEHSKVICKCCCDKLQEVCRFTSMVQDNDKILRLRHPKQKGEATMWPKPISIDKNIFDSSDVKIKDEVLTDDEYSAAMEVGKGFATVDIKVEPEEILPDKIEITVNGTISLNEYKSENPVTNGDDCEVYEQEEKTNKDTTESDKNKSKKPEIKKHSAAYRRLRQKANERKRKYIMNMTPEEKERKRMKDREYYHKRQAQNKTKSIKDMSESEQKRVRELWKKKAQRYKEKKRRMMEESMMENNSHSAHESDSGRGPDTSQDEVDLHSFFAEYQLATLKEIEKLN